MNAPLVRSQQAIEKRLRQLGIDLSNERGFHDQRLRFSKTPMRNSSTTWILRNEREAVEPSAMPLGMAGDLGISSGECILYYGYKEEWQVKRRDEFEFVGSNLHFLIYASERLPQLRFRLEWTGAKTVDGTVQYPGVGAAHPHWQFDVERPWLQKLAATDGAAATIIDVDLAAAVEEVDLTGAATGSAAADNAAPQRSDALLAFHRLHLPARSMWHEIPCVMPNEASAQQHTPQHDGEIDRWVISALRYLASEFERYF